MVLRWVLVAAMLTLAWSGTALADPTWAEIKAVDDWVEHGTRKHDDAGEVVVKRTMLDEVYCFQGIATVDVRADILLQVSMDIESAIHWSSAGVSEAETLSKQGDVLEYYQLLDVPAWTMSKDRFWFMRGHVERNGATVAFVWERLIEGGAHAETYQSVIEAHPKAIEPPVNAGAWEFTGLEGGNTEVRYTICSVSGGEIPEKLGMVVTTTTLPDTVGDLVKEGRRRQNK